jgi:hypothetical protein
LAHGYLDPLLWAHGEAEHQGEDHVVKQSCSSQDILEAKRERERKDCVFNVPSKHG